MSRIGKIVGVALAVASFATPVLSQEQDIQIICAPLVGTAAASYDCLPVLEDRTCECPAGFVAVQLEAPAVIITEPAATVVNTPG